MSDRRARHHRDPRKTSIFRKCRLLATGPIRPSPMLVQPKRFAFTFDAQCDWTLALWLDDALFRIAHCLCVPATDGSQSIAIESRDRGEILGCRQSSPCRFAWPAIAAILSRADPDGQYRYPHRWPRCVGERSVHDLRRSKWHRPVDFQSMLRSRDPAGASSRPRHGGRARIESLWSCGLLGAAHVLGGHAWNRDVQRLAIGCPVAGKRTALWHQSDLYVGAR